MHLPTFVLTYEQTFQAYVTSPYLLFECISGVTDNSGVIELQFIIMMICFSLFVLVTAEGWPTIELDLNHVTPVPAMSWSRAYIILFLFIGHFVFSNLFVAVIIGQIDKGKSKLFSFFSFLNLFHDKLL